MRVATTRTAWADPGRFGVRAEEALVADAGGLRVDLGPDARLEVAIGERRDWPRRAFGALGVAQAVPGLHQYWHPHLLGGRAVGTARLGGAEVALDAAAYAEKNWGAAFSDHWWWGQAFPERRRVRGVRGRADPGRAGRRGADGDRRARRLRARAPGAAGRADGDGGDRRGVAGARPLAALLGAARGRGGRAPRRPRCRCRCRGSGRSSRARARCWPAASRSRCGAGGACSTAASRRSPGSSTALRRPAPGEPRS